MKKLVLVLVFAFVLFMLFAILVIPAHATCTDINKDLGGADYSYQTGYVTQYPDGADNPIVDPAPIPTPEPGDDGENQYTWRWNTNNDDAPEPGGKNK